MFDVLLRGGTLVDGTGTEPRPADVGIADGRITAVGDLAAAESRAVLDCRGAVVAPGFIDVHTHSDFTRLLSPAADSQIYQGVTTEVVGNCGFSAAPWRGAAPALQGSFLARYGLVPEWSDLAGYLDAVDRRGSAINCATLIGHNTVRAAVIGLAARPARVEEIDAMARDIAAGLDAGAVGVSSGLAYAPGNAATADELATLAAIAGRRGAVYTTHIRGEDVRLIESVEEALATARAAGVATQLSHHPAKFPSNGRTPETLARIDAARAAGHDVTCDLHPYTAGATWMIQLLPPSVLADGVADLGARLGARAFRERVRAELMRATDLVAPVQLIRAGRWSDLRFEHGLAMTDAIGRDLASLASDRGQEPFDTLFDLMAAQGDALGEAVVTAWVYDETDVRATLAHATSMIGSDGYTLDTSGPLAGWRFHPRSWGTFPRVLGRYVREVQLIPLADAVRKMTSTPAERFGLRHRGRVERGWYADVTVFDPGTITDRATYEAPNVTATGVRHVVVNGVPVLRDGIHLGALPGRALRRGAS